MLHSCVTKAAHSWKGPYDHDRHQSHRGVGGVRSIKLASECRHEGTNDEQHAQCTCQLCRDGSGALQCLSVTQGI